MPSDNTRKKRRLHRENPHCHWCGKLTVLDRLNAHNEATVDHVIALREWKRLARAGNKPDRRDVVLACRACNQRRNDDENRRTNAHQVPRGDWATPPALPSGEEAAVDG